MSTAYTSSEVAIWPPENEGGGVVLWRVFSYGNGLQSRKRLRWFRDRAAARRYMLRHPELIVKEGQ